LHASSHAVGAPQLIQGHEMYAPKPASALGYCARHADWHAGCPASPGLLAQALKQMPRSTQSVLWAQAVSWGQQSAAVHFSQAVAPWPLHALAPPSEASPAGESEAASGAPPQQEAPAPWVRQVAKADCAA
jgi:hypothetical protein